MKRILAIAATACALAGGSGIVRAADPSTNAVPMPRGGMRAKTGGAIMRPLPAGSKAIVFLDALEDARGAEALAAYVKRFKAMTRLNVQTAKGDAAAYENEKGNVVIALVSKGDLAVMPAKRMAIVPVGTDDAATARDLWKATVAVFSLMGDAPNDFNGTALIRGAAESIGIPFVETVFYKKALEEGWAPEPKDEFQKRLWDEHQAKKAAHPATEAK